MYITAYVHCTTSYLHASDHRGWSESDGIMNLTVNSHRHTSRVHNPIKPTYDFYFKAGRPGLLFIQKFRHKCGQIKLFFYRFLSAIRL